MYERFTDRARKAMQLANQEAHRLNHEYIGTEHILLGLIKEGSGVAARVLKNLDVVLKKPGIDLHEIRLEVEKVVQSGPDIVPMGKLPQTPRAKKVIEYSMEEARDLNDNHVGTEHLLLGMLREQEGVAAQVLMNLGLKLEEARGIVYIFDSSGRKEQEKMDLPTAAEVRRMQDCCFDCARKYGDEFGFPDLVVSDVVWRSISPTGDEGGLLCPSCICRRLAIAKIKCVGTFMSGPLSEQGQ